MKIGMVWLFALMLLCLPRLSGADEPIRVWAPATPGSLPLVLAVREMPQLALQWFDNHSRAHALFLRGDVPLLCTGLSVGVKLFEQGVPVRMIASHVSGLTFLMTDRPVRNFHDLRGQTLVLPFEGSPIQEVTRFLMEQEGLGWGREIPIEYAPFSATLHRFRQGEIRAAALPEPFVSQLLATGTGQIAFAYADQWNACTKTDSGYPQVGIFVQQQWADEHRSLIRGFTDALERAVIRIIQDPEGVVSETGAQLPFPPDLLKASLGRTRFHMLRGKALVQAVNAYYRTIGYPAALSNSRKAQSHEPFDAFFVTD